MLRAAIMWFTAVTLPLPLAAQTAPPKPAAAPGDATLAQFQAAARRKIERRDTDGDGKISLPEWGGGNSGDSPKRNQAFARIDKNGDGQLDGGDIDTELANRFTRLDKDRSGTLTREERRARKKDSAGMQ